LCREAREEILILTKPAFSGPREKLDELLDQEPQILRRRIRASCIYEIPKDEGQKRSQFEVINRAVRASEEARGMKELP
jgi:hypothetical protein